ncbi:unnamed protein product [Lasius platythorax]|uniref:Uncharacterized protein n=1 Tax=Lasius platythorax TaxID=488582 RepID=A0AAV2N2U5_9HYME
MKRARTATQSADFPAYWLWPCRKRPRCGKYVRVAVPSKVPPLPSSSNQHHHLSAKATDFCECGNGAATRSLINNEHVAATSG